MISDDVINNKNNFRIETINSNIYFCIDPPNYDHKTYNVKFNTLLDFVDDFGECDLGKDYFMSSYAILSENQGLKDVKDWYCLYCSEVCDSDFIAYYAKSDNLKGEAFISLHNDCKTDFDSMISDLVSNNKKYFISDDLA